MGENYKKMFPELIAKVALNIDDNELNQLVISRILANVSILVETAYNGTEALNKLQQGITPDFIILDMEMPVMNGLQTATAIRKIHGKNIPIIINSGYISAAEMWHLHHLDIYNFLEKPYNIHDIFKCLSACIQKQHID